MRDNDWTDDQRVSWWKKEHESLKQRSVVKSEINPRTKKSYWLFYRDDGGIGWAYPTKAEAEAERRRSIEFAKKASTHEYWQEAEETES